MLRRIISMLLCVVMVISIVPAQACATNDVVEEISEQIPETEPVAETIAPTEGDTMPIGEIVETTAPTEEETEPTEDMTVPTDETTAPTEEVIVPTEATAIQEELPDLEQIEASVYMESARSVADSGVCGENLTWFFDTYSGDLIISGTGEMFEFEYMEAPWHIYQDQIGCIYIEDGVESISDFAFAQLVNLREVILPLSLISIGRGAFLPGYVYVDFFYEGCEHQWSDIGGDDVLEDGGYLSCAENENEYDDDHTTEFSCSVCGLVLEPGIPHDYEYGICTICGYEDPDYTIVDFGSCGEDLTWTFEEDGTLTISGTGDMEDNPWWQYRESITSLVLEQGLTSIANGAFEECYQLSKLSIPDSVTTIGDYAFACCYSLDDISISTAATYIGKGAFLDCTSMESIVLPVGITEISASLFVGCTELSSIQLPTQIISVGDYAFAGCEKLNSITIPEGVISIGAGAFEESGLKTVILPKSIESIGADAFYPENVFYAGNENDRNQITLGPYDYFVTDSNWHYNSTEPHNFTEIDTLDIEPTCTEVGFYGGTHCSVCNSVLCAQEEIPALEHDYQLKITPPGCTERGYTTYSCSRCSDNYLDDYTEATGHTEEVDVEVPPSCVETGLTEGYHCSVCNEILLEQEIVPALGHLFDDYIFNEDATCTNDGTMTSACAYGCGATDTQVADASALGHTEVWDEGYEPTCTQTGLTDGYHCSVCNEILLGQEIIPALDHDWSFWVSKEPDCNDSGIEKHVCIRCEEERIEEIPALGHSYENDFCTACGEIDPSIFPITGTSGRYVSWVLDAEGVLTFTGTGDMEAVNWGTYVDYVKSVVVSEGITGIADYAFSVQYSSNGFGYCNLTDITLPESLLTIGKYAFSGCSSLQSITVPSNVTTIEYDTFGGCTNLKNVQLPDSITKIDSYAFSGCESLVEITIPQHVTSIGSHTFSDSGLREIVIPDKVSYIGSRAFSNCTNLQKVNVLGGGTSSVEIGSYCFEYCLNLKEILLPLAISEIESSAFMECNSLNDVYYKGTETDRNAIVIGNNNSWLTGAIWHYNTSSCSHLSTEQHTQQDATCTQNGYTAGIYCSDCESWISGHVEIPANHTWNEGMVTKDPTNTETGSCIYTCTACGEIRIEELPTLDHVHNYNTTVTAPTCTEEGYTTYTCSCGNSYVNDKTEAVGHSFADGVCSLCSAVENRVSVPASLLGNYDSVWIDGKEYAAQTEGDICYVDLPDSNARVITTYTYHIDAAAEDGVDAHRRYPVSMQVWTLENRNGVYTATRQEDFDNILQYSGMAIRVAGLRGIRMITSIDASKKQSLINDGLAGYTLQEYGTAIAWASQIGTTNPLTLGKSYVSSNYAYKKDVADPIYRHANGVIQYTNVLVNFSNEQCKNDIAMRPYMILADAEGNEITIYGGIVERSIGYIALRNRNTFTSDSEPYEYIWEIIHHVYGDTYDADWKPTWSDTIM